MLRMLEKILCEVKNNQILYNKISHRFLLTTKLFTMWKSLIRNVFVGPSNELSLSCLETYLIYTLNISKLINLKFGAWILKVLFCKKKIPGTFVKRTYDILIGVLVSF
jgi:hypothetical protein